MKAFRLLRPGQTELVDVAEPVPGPTDVLLRVGSASFCHSDVELLHMPANVPGIPLPVTLGHEVVGLVEEIGDQVDGFELGQPVAVYIIEGCGTCTACRQGFDNLCERGVVRTPGVHYDGGVAERIVVASHRLLPLNGVDVTTAAPLTDAGLSAYHAVEWVRGRLQPHATALIIGIGGLGHLALQIVAATSASRIIAVDVDQAKVDLAANLGADAALVADSSTAAAVRDANGGKCVDVVLDFAGVQPSIDLGVDVICRGGMIAVTGMGGGHIPHAHGFGGPTRRVPPETAVVTTFAGSRHDLRGVLALAERGLVHVEATHYRLSAAPAAFAAVKVGGVVGRAVINP